MTSSSGASRCFRLLLDNPLCEMIRTHFPHQPWQPAVTTKGVITPGESVSSLRIHDGPPLSTSAAIEATTVTGPPTSRSKKARLFRNGTNRQCWTKTSTRARWQNRERLLWIFQQTSFDPFKPVCVSTGPDCEWIDVLLVGRFSTLDGSGRAIPLEPTPFISRANDLSLR